MRRIWLVLAVACCLVGLTIADEAPAEKDVKSKVVSVALFKNGLAVVKRQVTLDGAGTYRLADVPEPVHGTFWVESNMPLEARVETRDRPAPPSEGMGVNIQEEMAGLKVTIHGRNNKNPVTGTVMPIPRKEEDADAAADAEGFRAPTPGSRFLILKTEKGVSYVDYADIAAIEAEGQPKQRMVKKPVLLLTAGNNVKAGPAQISYLAHGLSWAPSYKVDLTDPKKLSIEQHAVIRNELVDFADTEVSLISGYPSVQFNNVVSPLAANQTWANFFGQLNGASRGQVFDNSMVTQQMAYTSNMRAISPVAPAIAPNTGDTLDLNFHPIGKRTLKKGSAISLATGKAEAEYERIVDWTIPDNRDEWGHPTGSNGRRVDPGSGETLQDDIWDALKFKNPLPFPMTSAPAMVVTAGNFSGQRSVLWTNKGEEATLRVNKALSIRARHVEYENQTGANGAAERDLVYLGGRRFRKVTVNGELRLCNHRAVDVKLIIKRHFSGDYVKGDGNPKIDLREEGVWTVNKRNELVWTINLKPAEEQTIKYQYTVLINF